MGVPNSPHEFDAAFARLLSPLVMILLLASGRDRPLHDGFAKSQNSLQLHGEQGQLNTTGQLLYYCFFMFAAMQCSVSSLAALQALDAVRCCVQSRMPHLLVETTMLRRLCCIVATCIIRLVKTICVISY